MSASAPSNWGPRFPQRATRSNAPQHLVFYMHQAYHTVARPRCCSVEYSMHPKLYPLFNYDYPLSLAVGPR